MGILKVTNKDGNTYVYDNYSYWDKETKKPKSKRKLIGKIDPATGEIVPTDGRGLKRGKRKNIRLDTLCNMQVRFFCAIDLMDKIAEKSGLLETMEGAFLRSYPQIMTLAYYSLLEKDAEIEFFERWLLTHYINTKKTLEKDDLIKLAKYVKKKCDRRSENEFAAMIFSDEFDTTFLGSLFDSVSPDEKWKYLQTAISYVRNHLLDYMREHLPEDITVTRMLLSLDGIGAIKDAHNTLLVGEVSEDQKNFYQLMEVEPPEQFLDPVVRIDEE